MTVSTSNKRIEYSGNGTTTVFAYNFRILDEAHIEVILEDSSGNGTTKTLTTHYTVSGVGADGGGNVTMVTAPATGEYLILRRAMPFTQGTDYVSGDPFPAETHEEALDELTMNDQELVEITDRCLRAPKQDSAFSDLPTVPNRNDRLLTFDSAGDVKATSYTNTQLATAVAASTTTDPVAVLQIEYQDGSDAVAGKFTLQQISYTVETNNLFVFNNIGYISPENYTQNSSTEVTMNFSINPSDRFVFLTNAVTSLAAGNTQNITHTIGGTTYNLSDYIIARNTPALFADGDTTPAVPYYEIYKTANTGATTITNFDSVSATKKIWVIFGDSNTTIDFTASNLKGNAGVDWTPATDDHMTCVWDGINWYCDISDNTA